MRLNRPKEILQYFKDERRAYLYIILPLFLAAITADYFSGVYVTFYIDAQEVTDLLLDILPVVNLAPLFVLGYMTILITAVLYPLLFDLSKLKGTLFFFSLIVFTRACFLVMTHLKSPSEAVPVTFPGMIDSFNFQNDLFFSGHAAVPFTIFLFYSKGEKMRYFFLIGSIVMSVTALLMHRHYTIDVFAAYYIAYATYKIGLIFYNRLPAPDNVIVLRKTVREEADIMHVMKRKPRKNIEKEQW